MSETKTFADVTVVHQSDGYAVECIYGWCEFRGAGIDPETEACEHADANPGHTVVVESHDWTEYHRLHPLEVSS